MQSVADGINRCPENQVHDAGMSMRAHDHQVGVNLLCDRDDGLSGTVRVSNHTRDLNASIPQSITNIGNIFIASLDLSGSRLISVKLAGNALLDVHDRHASTVTPRQRSRM